FADTPFAGMLPYPQLARSISSLFLGLELYGHLDPASDASAEAYEALAGLAGMSSMLMAGLASLPVDDAHP
ncbi:MAG: hypothetical protein R2706_13765, partial [Acidimicrobiales bacterium]